ncbi:hypothetical protein C8R47DRAFT_1204351 [Mycena vitilis]|nr:hypothetical protein C8R47DRAFT_1204351 [Mycena vitilis]
MPLQPSVTQIRLNNIKACLAVTADSLEVLASAFKEPSLQTILYTTQSLIRNLETIKQNKDQCAQFLEQAHELLNAVLVTCIKSDTGMDLAPSVLIHIAKLTETLHKVHTFIEAQQKGSKIKRLFRQGELSNLLQGCKEGLQQGLDSFKIDMGKIMKDITNLQKESEERHEEVIKLIEALTGASSDQASSISGVYSGSYNSSTSMPMLPSEPKIFHGRDVEVSDILQLFREGNPRIAILGAGGMGKTTVARVVLHHTDITTRYEQHRHFITCDSAGTKAELLALIGDHLGLKLGKTPAQALVRHFVEAPPSLLILDNLEMVWERKESYDTHNLGEVDRILALTDNMPLAIAISLLAHLVDSEGCTRVLARWEQEKTSVISDGWDKKSNLDSSILLSLLSPRLKMVPHSYKLLSLLSMLPNGLSDVDLVQSKLPIDNILGCRTVLVGTSLAYIDSDKRLKVLVPIREYMQKNQPPENDLIRPLREYFRELLQLQKEYHGTVSGSGSGSGSGTSARLSSNFANIQNVLQDGLHRGHPDLVDSIYCACYLSQFSRLTSPEVIPLMRQIPDNFPLPCDHRLEAYFALEVLQSWEHHRIEDSENVISRASTHIEQCNDSDLKCTFYLTLSTHYAASGKSLWKVVARLNILGGGPARQKFELNGIRIMYYRG